MSGQVIGFHGPGCGCPGCRGGGMAASCGSCGCNPCQCNQGPGWGYWGRHLRECHNELAQLKCLIAEIIAEIGGPVKTGPIRGVVDGSDAAQGDVGEYVTGTATVNYAAYPAVTDVIVTPLVVQPGDWDLWVSLVFTTDFGGANFSLSPRPTGMTSDMLGGINFAATASPSFQQETVIGQTGRGNFTVPTLIAFRVGVSQNSDASLPAGTAFLRVDARRRR